MAFSGAGSSVQFRLFCVSSLGTRPVLVLPHQSVRPFISAVSCCCRIQQKKATLLLAILLFDWLIYSHHSFAFSVTHPSLIFSISASSSSSSSTSCIVYFHIHIIYMPVFVLTISIIWSWRLLFSLSFSPSLTAAPVIIALVTGTTWLTQSERP